MNRPFNGTPTKKQRRAHSQAQRHGNPVVHEREQSAQAQRRGNPVVCEQEQSADTVRRAIAREESGMQEHESLQ